jgi:hypothetical protein
MMRRPLLVVLAMVFAVAAGIALGAGPLSTARSPEPASPAAEESAAPPAPSDPRAAYADALAAAVSSRLYDGDELAGRSVAVVRMPGVPDDQLAALTGQVGLTGATLVSQYTVRAELLDPARKSLVDTLGSQLAEQLSETTVPADATAYDRVGALLGGVVATGERKGAAPATDAATIEQSLSSAGLVDVVQAASVRAPIVLVYLGEDAGESADQALQGLVAGLVGTARSVVVVGSAAAAADGGQLARFRADELAPAVTTVDGVDGSAGQVTAALATARSFTDVGGDFGAAGADGPVPMG